MTPASIIPSPLETLPPPRPPCACGVYPCNDLDGACTPCVLADVHGEPRPTRPVPPPDQAAAWATRQRGIARDNAITADLWAQMDSDARQRALALSGTAPQWVDWPTAPGHWWWRMEGHDDELVRVDADLRMETFGHGGFPRPRQAALCGWRFLDARLTPPAAPGDR